MAWTGGLRAVLADFSGGWRPPKPDVEHSAEPSADTVWPMQLMHWGAAPDDEAANVWRRAAMKIGQLQHDHWLVERKARDGSTRRVIASSWIASGHGYALDFYPFSCSLAYHVRAIQPALGRFVELSRSPKRADEARERALLNETVSDWLLGWVAVALKEENGKPAGVVPSAQHCPDAPYPLERETGCDLVGLCFVAAAVANYVYARWRGRWRKCLRDAEATYQKREARAAHKGAKVHATSDAATNGEESPKLTLRTVVATKRLALSAKRRSEIRVKSKMGLLALSVTTVIDQAPPGLRPV